LYLIHYYTDGKGNIPGQDNMNALAGKHDKNSRIKLGKISDYIKVLAERGKAAGEPYVKHVDGDVWELRPIRDRILFAAWDEEEQGFVLLHQFMKQTRKTPQKEIDIAKRRLQELREDKDDE
jgi:phage-related protein